MNINIELISPVQKKMAEMHVRMINFTQKMLERDEFKNNYPNY
jgi:hypothetical protein